VSVARRTYSPTATVAAANAAAAHGSARAAAGASASPTPAILRTIARRATATIAGLLLWGTVAGCGSTTFVGDLPPAAEPAVSPRLEQRPAGRIVPIGNAPEGAAADPVTGLVAVGLREPDRLALVDGTSGEVTTRVPLPGAPRHLGLAGLGGPVLVPAERADELIRVALPGGRADDVPVGVFPHDAVAAAGRIFVGDERGNTISVVDGDGVRRIPVATQPGGLAPVDGGRVLAVVSVRERVVELYDTRTLERLGQAPAGAGPTHVVPGSEGRIYVVDTTGDGLLVFETRPELRLTRRLALLGAPYGLAVDPEHGRLWVTLTATNEVVELAAGARPHVLRTLPSVRQPNTVAVDPATGRAYITGSADGVLQLLDPPRRR
jgi:DNA-binding beta-propeller fold protein YncE